MTRSTKEHGAWQELVAGYALHALDEADEARLIAHLAECGECRDDLDAHSLTASHLASLADDPETAPPSWSKLRAGVLGDEPAPVVSLDERRSGRWSGRSLLAAAAGVVVFAGAVVAGVHGIHSSGGGSVPSALDRCAVTLGCVEVDLRSSDGSRRAAVVVNHGTAEVQPISLHQQASGRTFVLWQLPRGGAPIPLGAFDSSGGLSDSARLSVSMAQTTAFAVSSEPAGVAPTKPTKVLAVGGVTS